MRAERTRMQAQGFAALAVALAWASGLSVQAAESDAPAGPDAAARRACELGKERKWKELLAECADADFGAGADAAEAYAARGQARAFSKDGARARDDLVKAVSLAPAKSQYLYFLADNFKNNLKDDRLALDAYLKAFEVDTSDVKGVSFGWLSIGSTIEAADALLRLVRDQEALDLLCRRYSMENVGKMPKAWRVNTLRCYGRAYAALGREEESLAAFKEANAVEAGK